MLHHIIKGIVQDHPAYAGITPVIEKEILHHDILHVMIQQGAMQNLTFIGGTALRMCFNSARLSEDLDFNAGFDFKPTQLQGLESEIKDFLEKKYETQVWVNNPSESKQGNTASWSISIEKMANRPDIPRQKMHIDVCAIPAFDVEKRPLINHYGIQVPTEGILIPVQSLAEILADKLIALAYRARRIKPRDVWDILWLQQRGTHFMPDLLSKKLNARNKEQNNFHQSLKIQLDKIKHDPEVKHDFIAEMSRFLPANLRERTIHNQEYWVYAQTEIASLGAKALGGTPNQFDMG